MWILFIIASLGIGTTFVRLFRFTLTQFEFWVASSVIGLVISAYTGLAMSYLMGFTASSQLLTTTFLIFLTLLGMWRLPKVTFEKESPTPNRTRGWLFGLGLILFLIGIMTLTTQDGGLYINNRHNYGDIRLHLSYINNFLFGQNIPVENPIFSGTPPSYPFLINFLSAQLTLLGLPVTFVINGLTLAGFGLIGTTIWMVCQRLLKNKAVSTWAVMLFFLGGGWGFVHLLPEWQAANWHSTFWQYTPHDFSLYQDKGYWLSNMVIAFLSTQRSLQLGLPLTLFILLQLFQTKQTDSIWRSLGLGFLIGLLPLVHISSALIVALFCLFLGWKSFSTLTPKVWLQHWSTVAVPAALIGLFLISTFIGQTESVTHYFRLNQSWMNDQNGFLVFWWKNAGVLLILNGLAYAWLKQKKHPATGLFGYSFVIFLLANFVIMQPWDFDNAKYLIYWFVFACMLGAFALMQLWERKQRWLVSVLVFILLASSTIDLIRRIAVPNMKIQVASAQELKMVEEVRAIIPPKSNVLTYGSVLNPIVDYLGRRMVYGDNPWLWSHGIDHEPRLAQIEQIYRGDSNALALIKELNIDYIIISDIERSKFQPLNEAFIQQNFPAVYSTLTQHLTVYKVN